MRRIAALWLTLILPASASDHPSRSLDQLAADADLIAIVRVEETDYTRTRGFVSKGLTTLRVLIPYRGIERDALVLVEEEGLEEDACYYPEVGPFEREGDRFLVFLRKVPDKSRYRGRAPGCRIPVLVTTDAGYAIRHPTDGLDLPTDRIREVQYSDPAAFIDAGELSFAEADRLVAEGIVAPVESDPMSPSDDRLIFRLGLPVSELRALMFPEP